MRIIFLTLSLLVLILLGCIGGNERTEITNEDTWVCDTTADGGVQWFRRSGGKVNGYRTFWNPSLADTTMDYFIDGVLFGPVKVWDKNGHSRIEGNHFNGKQNGLWRYWSENGRIEKLKIFNRNGIPVFRAKWSTEGTIEELHCEIRMLQISETYLYVIGELHEDMELYLVKEKGERLIDERGRLIEYSSSDSLIQMRWQTSDGISVPFWTEVIKLGTARTYGDLLSPYISVRR
jgi:hypothetical protein